MIFTLGINHKTASVALREKIALVPQQVQAMLDVLKDHPMIDEALIVSTCNRTEIYVVAHFHQPDVILEIWNRFMTIDLQERTELSHHFYFHSHQAAVSHLFRVACGLDSLILGEPQILGQLKAAYRLAKQQGTVGKFLNYQFQQAFKVAKHVRTQTGISLYAVSIAYAAVMLSKQIFVELKTAQVLLIGAGETIELVARHLLEQGVTQFTIANRTEKRAQLLMAGLDHPMEYIALNQLEDYLHLADIVISSTNADTILVTQQAVKNALKRRRYHPMFMLDLAVPRDLDPDIANLDDVYLYTIDDLNHIIQSNLNARMQAATMAETMVQAAVIEWESWYNTQKNNHILQLLALQMKQLQLEALEKGYQALEKGMAPEDVLQKMSHQLSAKLMHPVRMLMKEAMKHPDPRQVKWLESIWLAHFPNGYQNSDVLISVEPRIQDDHENH